MARLLLLLLVSVAGAQQDATTEGGQPLEAVVTSEPTSTTRMDNVVTAASSIPPDVSTTVALSEVTSGQQKTDEGTLKAEDYSPTSTSTRAVSTIENVNTPSTSPSSATSKETVPVNVQNSTAAPLGVTTGYPVSTDHSTTTSYRFTESSSENIARTDMTTTSIKVTSPSTVQEYPTTPRSVSSTTTRQIPTTDRPQSTHGPRSTVQIQEITSTVRTTPSTEANEVRVTQTSSTVKPVVNPDAYSSNIGSSIDSIDQGDKIDSIDQGDKIDRIDQVDKTDSTSTSRPYTATPVRFASKPTRLQVVTRSPSTRIDDVSTTPKSAPVAAASNVSPIFTSPPSQQIQVSGTRKKGGINLKKKNKKKDNGISSLIYIPLMIQAQMFPMMLMNLKFLALKALTLGKIALLILGLNLLRNAMLGYDSADEQYEHETLASQHYGYNGSPEYGSWVNKRMYTPSASSKGDQVYYTQYKPTTTQNTSQRRMVLESNGQRPNHYVVKPKFSRTSLSPENNENYPYRAYRNQDSQKTKSTRQE